MTKDSRGHNKEQQIYVEHLYFQQGSFLEALMAA